MKSVPLLLALLAIAGCGGGTTGGAIGDGNVPAGFYTATSQVLRPNVAARSYTGRLSVASDGTVRLFGLDASNSKLAIARIAGQTNDNGTNANATLDGLASTGDLTIGSSNLASFQGTAFSLTADGLQTNLPTLGTGTTLTAGTYRGELIQLGTNGSVTDWGTATATLTITTANGADPVNTLTTTVISSAGSNGTVQARLLANGTATGPTATTANWASDGTALTLRLTGGQWGAGFFLVLDRRTP